MRDYGPGVPTEMLTQIFDPFFRVEEARDEETGGIGLGLSIAKRAVRLHRGTITAQNTGPGLRVQIDIPTLIPKFCNTGSAEGTDGSRTEKQSSPQLVATAMGIQTQHIEVTVGGDMDLSGTLRSPANPGAPAEN